MGNRSINLELISNSEIIGIGEQTILVSPLNNQGDNNSEQYDHHVNNTSFSTPQSQVVLADNKEKV